MRDIARRGLEIAKAISAEAPKRFVPPVEGAQPEGEAVLPRDLASNTRGYLERVAKQINGTYEKGWYDACAVMMRRLLETLIIECFESRNVASKIKNPQTNDFLPLSDLITRMASESSWNLGRVTRRALPHLKRLGDLSAHCRRYNARRDDVDRLRDDFRVVCEEFFYISELK